MRIFIFLAGTQNVASCDDGRSLHQIEICIAQNKPFCAGRLKIDFDARMGALPLAIQDHAIAELAVVHALTQANADLGSGRC